MRHATHTNGRAALRAVASALLLVSCASAGKAPESTATAAPIDVRQANVVIRIWKPLSAETAYPDGQISEITVWQYDDAGELVKEQNLAGDRSLVSQKTYSRTSPGAIEATSQNSAGDTIGKSVRELAGDVLLRETQLSPKGEVQSVEEYAYDGAGRKTRWTVRTSTGGQVSSEYVYERGKQVRILVRDAAGATIKRFEQTRDGDGNLKKEEEYDSSGVLVSRTVYTWQNGFLVREERQNPAGGLLSAIQYVNDDEGNPVTETLLDRNGKALEVKTRTWKLFTRTAVPN